MTYTTSIMSLVRKHEAFLMQQICPIMPGRLIKARHDSRLYVIIEYGDNFVYCIPYEEFMGSSTIVTLIDINAFGDGEYDIVRDI